MDPRKAPLPERLGLAPLAVDEIEELLADNRSKPAAAAVVLFWQEVRRLGLAPGLMHKRSITIASGEQAGDWKLYVETMSGLRVVIGESKDAASLWLLLVKPAKDVTMRQAIEEATSRAK